MHKGVWAYIGMHKNYVGRLHMTRGFITNYVEVLGSFYVRSFYPSPFPPHPLPCTLYEIFNLERFYDMLEGTVPALLLVLFATCLRILRKEAGMSLLHES